MTPPRNRFHSSPERFLPDLNAAADYTPVDMLYNIGRIEGEPPRGYDVMDHMTHERLFLTNQGNKEIEDRVRANLGQKSILAYLRDDGDYHVYWVPPGTQLLKKVLEDAPYNESYMASLREKAQILLSKLRRLDPNAFGVNINSIALAHNGVDGGPDDNYLTIVPPLSAPTEENE